MVLIMMMLMMTVMCLGKRCSVSIVDIGKFNHFLIALLVSSSSFSSTHFVNVNLTDDARSFMISDDDDDYDDVKLKHREGILFRKIKS